ncbi:helix-turn-helix domain-containing protein [Thioalkalivibrio sp. ALgr3]|uniref:helix-turn-helix domain-containing protein n=1 Tax=Thioalkalivibrio sp. ALgr3 TaxID=1239292 RepID=UPI0018CAD0D0|nr:helix-turn-helix domain-containing protein [Thioalkalivibrio sp. ALgr3]
MRQTLAIDCLAGKQYIAAAMAQSRGMDSDDRKALANNLHLLMQHHDHSQAFLQQKTGVSQRTVSNLLNPDSPHAPTITKINAVADYYGLKGWQLLVPGQTLETLLSGKRLEHVVHSYIHADEDGRRYIERVSEKESEYRVDPPEEPQKCG